MLTVGSGNFSQIEIVDVVFGDFIQVDEHGKSVGSWNGLGDGGRGLIDFRAAVTCVVDVRVSCDRVVLRLGGDCLIDWFREGDLEPFLLDIDLLDFKRNGSIPIDALQREWFGSTHWPLGVGGESARDSLACS